MSRPIVVCIWRGKVHVTSCFFGIARFFDTGSTKYTFWIGRQSCKRLDKYAIIKYHFSIWNNMHRQYIKHTNVHVIPRSRLVSQRVRVFIYITGHFVSTWNKLAVWNFFSQARISQLIKSCSYVSKLFLNKISLE